MESKEIIENKLKKLPQLEQNLQAIDDKIERLIINRKYLYRKVKGYRKIKDIHDKTNQTV